MPPRSAVPAIGESPSAFPCYDVDFYLHAVYVRRSPAIRASPLTLPLWLHCFSNVILDKSHSLCVGFLIPWRQVSVVATFSGCEEDHIPGQPWALCCEYFLLYFNLTFGAILTAKACLFVTASGPLHLGLSLTRAFSSGIVTGLVPSHLLVACVAFRREAFLTAVSNSLLLPGALSIPVLIYFHHWSHYSLSLSSALNCLIISSLSLSPGM